MMTDCSNPEAIYENINNGHLDLGTHTEKKQPPQNTGSVSVKKRKPRAAEVCLCLLCALLLTAVIVICVFYINERKHIHNLTEEREQILNHNNNLTEEKEQILKDKNLLHHWLNERDRLADNFKWIYYSFSFYYISSEKKGWSDSRRYCQQRGADLAVEFLLKFVHNDSFWVGWRETDGKWKWIDDPTVGNGFGANSSNCAGLTGEHIYSYSCDSVRGWICKKTYS